MSSEMSSRFSTPLTKLARFFERSRDQWKAKVLLLRKETKRLKNQIYALGKSRDTWKQRARTSEARLKQLEREIAALKCRG